MADPTRVKNFDPDPSLVTLDTLPFVTPPYLLFLPQFGDIVGIPCIIYWHRKTVICHLSWNIANFLLYQLFCVTLNKPQGLSYDTVGLDLQVPVFGHGQLYVGFSQSKQSQKIKVKLEKNKFIYQEYLWFGFEIGKFPLITLNFSNFYPLGKKKSLRVGSESTRVEGGSASYLLRVKSKLGSCRVRAHL